MDGKGFTASIESGETLTTSIVLRLTLSKDNGVPRVKNSAGPPSLRHVLLGTPCYSLRGIGPGVGVAGHRIRVPGLPSLAGRRLVVAGRNSEGLEGGKAECSPCHWLQCPAHPYSEDRLQN